MESDLPIYVFIVPLSPFVAAHIRFIGIGMTAADLDRLVAHLRLMQRALFPPTPEDPDGA